MQKDKVLFVFGDITIGERSAGNIYRFIFVDDEDLARQLFEEIMDFKRFGFELVQTFGSAESALDYLEKNPVDAVITDIKMGQMSGIGLCEKARSLYPEIQLVLLTGYRDFDYARQAIRQNVFDYLVKPTSYADLESLFTRLREYLDARAQSSPKTAPEEPEYQGLIQKMRQLAKENYDTGFSLEKAAETLAMSPAYLSRLFKQQCGKNYSDYLIELRIQRVKELLADPTVKVYEAGYQVGYKNTQHFYKIFKQATGMTPTEYRLAHTKGAGQEETD